MNLAKNTVLINLSLFTLHWVCVRLYSSYCVPYGLKEFLYSIVQSASPFCIGLNYVQFYSIELYYTLWLCSLVSVLKLVKDYSKNIVSGVRE